MATALTRLPSPRILRIRNTKIILDEELARVYGVPTSRLNQAVKRNSRRFPKDFAFRLTAAEHKALKSQIVISSGTHGGRRTAPWAFTEHGAIMVASLLNTARAIHMSVFVVRAFVHLRELAGDHSVIAAKLAELERRVTGHDGELTAIIRALRRLLNPPARPRRAIGFSAGRSLRRDG